MDELCATPLVICVPQTNLFESKSFKGISMDTIDVVTKTSLGSMMNILGRRVSQGAVEVRGTESVPSLAI